MSVNRIRVLRLRAFGSCDENNTQGFDAMEAVSWDLGDVPVTDFPDVCDPMLATVVHQVNDSYCSHLTSIGGVDWLCPGCSEAVLELAYRCVGTVLSGRPQLERSRIHVRLALEQAAIAAAACGPTPYTGQVLDLVGGWVSDSSAVTTAQLEELADARPVSGLAVERIASEVVAAAAAAGTRECGRHAARSCVAAIAAHRPTPAMADFHRIVDRFLSLSSETEQAGSGRRVVWLR